MNINYFNFLMFLQNTMTKFYFSAEVLHIRRLKTLFQDKYAIKKKSDSV